MLQHRFPHVIAWGQAISGAKGDVTIGGRLLETNEGKSVGEERKIAQESQ